MIDFEVVCGDDEDEGIPDTEEEISSGRALNFKRLVIGADWLRVRCATDGLQYRAPDVLRDFVNQGILESVYPRFSECENHRFSPSYYLTCLLERIHNCHDLPIDVSWIKATRVVSVTPLKKYKKEKVEYRFTYGLSLISVTTRKLIQDPKNPLTLEERFDRLESIVAKLLEGKVT